MVLTNRQIEIAKYLLDTQRTVKASDVASHFDVSVRTVRNDIANVQSFFDEQRIILKRIPNKGMTISASKEQKQRAYALLASDQCNVYSQEERIRLICLLLLSAIRATYEELANDIGVSRQTIINDFSSVEQTLDKYSIHIQRIPGQGLSVSGGEYDVRTAFSDVLGQTKSGCRRLEERLLVRYDEIRRLMTGVESAYGVKYLISDLMLRTLAFARLRSERGCSFSSEEERDYLRKAGRDKAFFELCGVLAKQGIKEEERWYFASVILSAKVVKPDESIRDFKLDDTVTGRFTEALLEELKVLLPDHTIRDKQFVRGLYTHLNVAVYRISNNIRIDNPLLEQIKMIIPLMFEFTKKTIRKHEPDYGLAFDENEIAYVAMHIDAVYEMHNQTENKLNILLACSFGIATSNILKTRITQILPDSNILGPVPAEEVPQMLGMGRVDLVITTSSNAKIRAVPMIRVNPLLPREDIDQIQATISQLMYGKHCEYFIRAYSQIAENTEQVKIAEFFQKEDIQILPTCDDWRQAIRISAQPLLNRRYITRRYVERMIESVNNFGNYMMIIPGVAFVHAGSDDGINQTGTSMLVLNAPVMFGTINPEPARVIVTLALKGNEGSSLLRMIYIFENKLNLLKLASGNVKTDEVYEMHS